MQRYYSDYYGRSVALIGKASKGGILEPVFADSRDAVLDNFESGELVDTALEMLDAGVEYLYLIRIDSSSLYEKYFDLQKVYTILESMTDIDIVLALNTSLNDYIVNYPNIFHFKNEFYYNEDPMFITDNLIESVNYVKINGTKTKHYFLRDSGVEGSFDAVVIDKDLYDLDTGDSIVVDYNSLKKVDIEFEILKFVNGKIENSITLKRTIDVSQKTNQLTDKPAREYFDFQNDDKPKFIARIKNKSINVYTDKTGYGVVYSDFDFDKYIAENTEYKYLVEDMALMCSKVDCVAVLKRNSKNYNQMLEDIMDIKNILNKEIDYGKYIVITASDCLYNSGFSSYTDGYEKEFSSLMATTPTETSLSYRENPSISEIKDDFTNTQIKDLADNGYVVLYNSIRNGIVPYKAVTLAEDGPYRLLKNVRVVNELSTRVKEITDQFIGKGNINTAQKLNQHIKALMSSMSDEKKIKNFQFEIAELSPSRIKILLEIQLYNETETVKTGIVSGT